MARFKTEALVLGSLNYSETSRIIHVLCKDEGRISLMAKGVRKAKGSGNAVLQTFNAVSLTYYLKQESSFGTLGTAELLHTWPALHTDLFSYSLACYWFEILTFASQPRLESRHLYNITLQFLGALSSPQVPVAERLGHLLHLFRSLGFELSSPVCASCSSPLVTQFDDHTGRFFCAACSAGQRFLPTTPREVLAIQAIYAAASGQVNGSPGGEQPEPAAALTLFHRYITRHIDHPLKSFAFLEKMRPETRRP